MMRSADFLEMVDTRALPTSRSNPPFRTNLSGVGDGFNEVDLAHTFLPTPVDANAWNGNKWLSSSDNLDRSRFAQHPAGHSNNVNRGNAARQQFSPTNFYTWWSQQRAETDWGSSFLRYAHLLSDDDIDQLWAKQLSVSVGPSMAVRSALESRRISLKQLAYDWDGYGAERIPDEDIDTFVDEVLQLMVGVQAPPPDIIPGADGSLQAEWHAHHFKIYYSFEPEGRREFFVQHVGQKPKAASNTGARESLRYALQTLFLQGA